MAKMIWILINLWLTFAATASMLGNVSISSRVEQDVQGVSRSSIYKCNKVVQARNRVACGPSERGACEADQGCCWDQSVRGVPWCTKAVIEHYTSPHAPYVNPIAELVTNKHIMTVDRLGVHFLIEFTVKPAHTVDAWNNWFQFTSNRGHRDERNPGVFAYGKKLQVCFGKTGGNNRCEDFENVLEIGEEIPVKIFQVANGNAKVVHVSVGSVKREYTNENPQTYHDLKVYTRNSIWNSDAVGTIFDLTVLNLDYTDLSAQFLPMTLDTSHACKLVIKMNGGSGTRLENMVGNEVLTELKEHTKGFANGGTTFSAESTLVVDHCEKQMIFKQLRTSEFNPITEVKVSADSKITELKFGYIDLLQYKQDVAGLSGNDAAERATEINVPYVSIKGSGKADIDGCTNCAMKFDKKTTRNGITVNGEVFMTVTIGASNIRNVDNTFKKYSGGLDESAAYPQDDVALISAKLASRKSQSAEIIFVPTGRHNVYSFYLKYTGGTGAMADMYTFCKNDFLSKRCAAFGFYDQTSTYPTFVPNLPIDKMAEKLNIFPNGKPDKMIFQSAKSPIDGEIPTPEEWDHNINDIIFNTNRALEDSAEEANIFAGSCFRYIKRNWFESSKDIRVNMCPENDGSYKFSFPDLPPLDIRAIIDFIYGEHWQSVNPNAKNWFDASVDEKMIINYVKVESLESGEDPKYKFEISLKPSLTNESIAKGEGYLLLPNLEFSILRKSSIKILINGRDHKITVTGSTDNTDGLLAESDDMLGSEVTFQGMPGNTDMAQGIRFTFSIPSNRFLMSGLKDYRPLAGYYEADAAGFVTSFDSLRNITLTKLILDTAVNAESFTFKSEVTMNSVTTKTTTSTKRQSVPKRKRKKSKKKSKKSRKSRKSRNQQAVTKLTSVTATTANPTDVASSDVLALNYKMVLSGQETHSCLYSKTPGYIADFLNSIQEKEFFDQPWMGYDEIGVSLSPTNDPQESICNNNYDDRVSEEEDWFVDDKEFDIKSGELKAELANVDPSFVLRFQIKLTEFVDDKWASVLHMTCGNDYGEIGDRIPAIYVSNTPRGDVKKLYICYSMNGEIQECQFSNPIVLNEWINVRISQTRVEEMKYLFSVVINGQPLKQSVNTQPRSFTQVKLYTSNPWVDAQPGKMKGISLRGGNKMPFVSLRQLDEVTVSRGKQVEGMKTFPKLSAEFVIRFELYVEDAALQGNEDWLSIIQMSTKPISSDSRDHGEHGNRVPAIYAKNINDNEVRLYICYETNKDRYPVCSEWNIPKKTWTNLRLSQRKIEESTVDVTTKNEGGTETYLARDRYYYSVYLNDIRIEWRENPHPLSYFGLHVYVGSPSRRNIDGKIRNLLVTDIPKKIGVRVSNIGFNCPIDTERSKDNREKRPAKSCQFLSKQIANGKITMELSGTMDAKKMHLAGTTNDDIPFGPKVKFDGSSTTTVILTVIPKSPTIDFTDDKILKLRFEGSLMFGEGGDTFPASLILNGDVIKLRIRRSVPVEDLTTIRLSPNDISAQFWVKPMGLIPVDYRSNMVTVELRSQFFMGRTFEGRPSLEFKKTSLNRIFLNPDNKVNSKFYACKGQKKTLKFSQLLKVISAGTYKGFLDGAEITDLCVARSDTDKWEVKDIDKSFDEGVSFRGAILTDFGRGGKTYQLPLYSKPTGQPATTKLCVAMPVLKWGTDRFPEVNLKPESSDDTDEPHSTTGLGDGDMITDEQGMVADEANQLVKDIELNDLVVADKYKCELSDAIGVENFNRGTYAQKSVRKESECVEECVKEMKNDPEYFGVAIKGTAERGLECYCVRNMKFDETIEAEYRSCILRAYDEHAVEMYDGKGFIKETEGPEFCYLVPFASNGVFRGEMRGYLKTFAFEEEGATLSFVADGGDRLNSMSYRTARNIELFGEVKGDVILQNEGVQIKTDPMQMDIKITINIDTETGEAKRNLRNAFKKVVQDRVDLFTSQKQKFLEMRQELNNYKRELATKIADKRSEIAKTDFQINSIHRARAINAFKRDCCMECGYVNMPGWKIDNKCSRKNNGRSMSCMRYTKDANIASNVGCIANCEAERARSFADAKQYHRQAAEARGIINDVEDCKENTRNAIKELERLRTTASDVMTQIDTAIEKIKGLVKGRGKAWDLLSSVQTVSKSSELTDVRCHIFTINFNNKVINDATLCFGGFYKDLAEKLFEDLQVTKRINEDHLYKISEEHNGVITLVLEKEGGNKESQQILDWLDEYDKCSTANKKRKAVFRRSSIRGLPEFHLADFTIYEKSTVDAFKETSPWEVARRRDTISKFSKLEQTPKPQNTSSSTSGKTTCALAQQIVSDYNDIAEYILHWTQENNAAKRDLNAVKNDAGNEINLSMFDVNGKNYTDTDLERIQYWQKDFKSGMKKWMDMETEKLERYNNEGVPLIHKQLTRMYTDEKKKTLKEFFQLQSVDGNNAIKRGSITNVTAETFTNLSQSILDILETGKKLDDVAAPIQDVVRRTDILRKRTINCSS